MSVAASTSLSPDITLNPLQGEARTIADWVTTFHLALAAVDPFTQQSAILLPTAARVLQTFSGSNCRMAWLVAGTPEQAQEFLGPLADDFLTFADPERQAIGELGLSELPALLHVNHGLEVVGMAQGWNPPQWREVTDVLSDQMMWSRVEIPLPSDPPGFHGTPAHGGGTPAQGPGAAAK